MELVKCVSESYRLLTRMTLFQTKLEHQYAAKKELQQKEIEELKKEVERKNEEYQKLSTAMSDLKRANEDLQSAIASKPSSTGTMSEKEKDLERTSRSDRSDSGQAISGCPLRAPP